MVALVVADITDIFHQARLEYWIREVTNNSENNVIFYLLGNKCDLVEKRDDDTIKSLKEFAEKNKIPFELTSAKTGENVDRMILRLSQDIKDKFYADFKPKQFDHRLRINSNGHHEENACSKSQITCCH